MHFVNRTVFFFLFYPHKKQPDHGICLYNVYMPEEQSPRKPRSITLTPPSYRDPQHPDKMIFPDPEKIPADLISPLGAITNVLRVELKKQEPDLEEAEQILGGLHRALAYWSGDEKTASEVSLDDVSNAMEHVEGGGRVRREFAKSIVRLMKLDVPKKAADSPDDVEQERKSKVRESIIDELSKHPRFASLLRTLTDAHPQASDSRIFASLAEGLPTLISEILAESKGLSKYAEASQDLYIDAEEMRKIYRNANRRTIHTGAVLDRLLHKSGLRSSIMNQVYGDYRTPETLPILSLHAAQRSYGIRPPQKTLVLDRPVKVSHPGERTRFIEPGAALSKIVAILQERKKVKDEEGSFFSEKDLANAATDLRLALSYVVENGRTLTQERNKDQPLPPFDAESFDTFLESILGDDERLNAMFEEARDTVDEMPAAFNGRDTVAEHDDFIRLTKAFGEQLLMQHEDENTPDLRSMILKATGKTSFPNATFIGVWPADTVIAFQEAETSQGDPNQGSAVLRFIDRLPTLAERALASCVDCTAEEKEQMKKAAYAFSELATNMEDRRSLLKEAAEGKKGGAQRTTAILEKYGAAYRTLFKRGLIDPIPTRPWYPPKEESQTEEEYQEMVTEILVDQTKKEKEAQEEYRKKQDQRMILELRRFLNPDKKNLTGTFIGTLGFAAAMSGARLEQAVLEKMRSVTTERAEEKEYEAPDVLMQRIDRSMYALQEAKDTLANLPDLHEYMTKALNAQDPIEIVDALYDDEIGIPRALTIINDAINTSYLDMEPYMPEKLVEKTKKDGQSRDLVRQETSPVFTEMNQVRHMRAELAETFNATIAVAYIRYYVLQNESKATTADQVKTIAKLKGLLNVPFGRKPKEFENVLMNLYGEDARELLINL